MERIKDIADKIRNFEIRGTKNTAIAVIDALKIFAQQTTTENKTVFLAELAQAQQLLFNTRKTEPLMRNALHYIINKVQQSNNQKVSELSTILITNADKFLSELDLYRNYAAEIGAQLVQNNMTIFTHCNSSLATLMLIKAKQNGKNFKVICTETRPTFQGRITARELTSQDIKTTFIIDSAAQVFLPKTDFIIVGADAITPKGNIVNKIGTSGIAILAHSAHKPFYAISELFKFDSTTLYNEQEGIEQRNPTEIWTDAPKNLNIQNPAFDVTHSKYIHGIICEKGIIPPKNILKVTKTIFSSPTIHLYS
ncbi:MAG: S-methyl-5-thioribose-1-phosphate isomerase [Nitrososphaerota archaeon]|jgi:ribose 1,5-bisphosphate isomerase|nr:S-methyl-5-thioribose-1-phosphate isomerase [Nitrososphaerota archaeon]